MFSSYQKLLRITAYVLRLLPSHEWYHNLIGRIIGPTEFDESGRHLQYRVQGEPLITNKNIFWKTYFSKRTSRIAPFCPFIVANDLIRLAGRIKRLVKVGYDLKHLFLLDSRHICMKLFLRHTHVKIHYQVVDYLRAKSLEGYTILKL